MPSNLARTSSTQSERGFILFCSDLPSCNWLCAEPTGVELVVQRVLHALLRSAATVHEEDKRETTWASANSFWYAVQVVAGGPGGPCVVFVSRTRTRAGRTASHAPVAAIACLVARARRCAMHAALSQIACRCRSDACLPSSVEHPEYPVPTVCLRAIAKHSAKVNSHGQLWMHVWQGVSRSCKGA